MRITIDTDDPAGAKALAVQTASALDPPLDAGAAPIEHIRRMSSVAAAPAEGADFTAQRPSIEQDSLVDGGRSAHSASTRAVEGGKARDLPLNPLRAGAAAAAGLRGASAQIHATPLAATDAGAAAAAMQGPGAPESPKPKPARAKAAKPRGKP